MIDRYFAKVVSIPDAYTVVVNKGEIHGMYKNQKFLVVGLGDVIVDPDSGEELERLEVVRGRVEVVHVQGKIATLKSCTYERAEEVKEITKISSKARYALFPQDTVTESVKPSAPRLKPLQDTELGDYVIME